MGGGKVEGRRGRCWETGKRDEECGRGVRRTVDALLVRSVIAEALPRSRVQ